MPGLRRILDHANRGFPYTIAPSRTPLERLRGLDFREKYRALAPQARAGIAVLRCVFYPFVAAIGIVSAIRHLPRFGFPLRWTEFFPMYALALLRNIPPVEYVFFGFTDRVRRSRSGDYLYWMDQPALQWLNRQRGASNSDVQDKALFAEICHRAGLPHAPTLLEFRGGLPVHPASGSLGGDLWVKPMGGSRGDGGRLWHVAEDGMFRSGEDALSQEHWQAQLAKRDCLVQQRLLNHPAMVPVTNGAAAVLRLVTVLERSGLCTLIGSSIALPQGSADSTTGALGCVPDLQDGTVAKVSLAGSDAATTHPDTGTVLVGFQLPCWAACRDLVLRAHREAFPAFASLGWDVVVTPDGPLLLEANSGWGTMGQQMDFGPLSDTPLGRIAADELERAPCG